MLFGGYNALKLNEEKTEFIIFGVHPSQHNNVSLTIGRNDIKLSESIEILGVKLYCYSKMDMEKHIMNTCRSSYMHIWKINSIRRYLSEHATKTLMNLSNGTRTSRLLQRHIRGATTSISAQISASTEYSCKS